MLTRRKKVENNSSVVKPENRLLRLFRPNDVFQGSFISQGNADREDAYGEDPKIIKNAVREIEYQSAKALLAFQMNQRSY